jgi:hypothetical protein
MVELYRDHAALSIQGFWMRCFELGGMSTPLDLDMFLHEAGPPTSREYNVIALALNEHFAEIGVTQTVTYIDFVGTTAIPRCRSGAIPDSEMQVGPVSGSYCPIRGRTYQLRSAL